MAPISSNLSNEKYLYDFVVSTTQASINAGLSDYLMNTKGKQPITYLIFLADDKGDPTTEKSLEEFLTISGGINPFDIPDGTDWHDPRIQILFHARFVCGIRMQSGIPPGMIKIVPGSTPQLQLPEPIVNLGTSSESVIFNMYCSNVTVVKNSPPSGWGATGTWSWYSQKSGAPWYVSTHTNLQTSAVDHELATPYFDEHPEEREALEERLNNLSGSAFSLQQLFFNLDSAIAQSTPTFVGVDDKAASYLLGISFIKLWASIAKEKGLPLVGISAVARSRDGSPLRLTGMERWVSPVVDPATGIRLPSPSQLELSATTLNYLCATDGHPLPGASSFSWNWIDPQDISQSSGVVAIKRDTIAQYIVNQMLPRARSSCIKPWSGVDAYDVVGGVNYSWSFQPGQEPTVTLQKSGPMVASIDYSYGARASDSDAATYGELNITSTYSCSIQFGSYDYTVSPAKYLAGNKFTIVQHLLVNTYIQWAATSSSANIVDKTCSDEYIMSVDDHGTLTCKPTGVSSTTDQSQTGDRSVIVNFFTGVNDMLNDVKNKSGNFLNAQIAPMPFDDVKDFVFPGGRVFSYVNATFSNFQDLSCLITYAKPTDGQFQAALRLAASVPQPKAIELDEVPPVAAFIAKVRAQNISDLQEISENKRGKTVVPAPPGAKSFKLTSVKDMTEVKQAFEFESKKTGTFDAPPNGATESKDKKNQTNGTAAFNHSTASNAPSAAGQDADVVKISTSTDLMLNYVQGKLVAPQGKFRALQTSDGDALLFAIDSVGQFNVIGESSGQTHTGWTTTNISSGLLKENGGQVNAFDVGQSAMHDNTISMGLSLRVNSSDTLFLSLLNSAAQPGSWISAPRWKSFPFDVKNGPSSVQITNIYFSETDQNQQFIMVDILRDPTSPLRDTSRYIVDPFSTNGRFWKQHQLPFGVEEGTYQSCIGRTSGAYVDGIYTSGTIQGAGQLAYVPLFNLTGDAAPMPTRLLLPNKTPATAMASARNDQKNSAKYGETDLYAVGDSTLYRWNGNDQVNDDSVGKALMTDTLFAGTDTLIGLCHNSTTTIFGRNASNIVYYTSCQADKLDDPKSWSIPIPVVNGAERITSFSNLKDGGNTVFAAGGGKIIQLTQATNTTTKMWQAQAVTVAAPPEAKAISFKSYTSTIQITGQDGLPVAGVEISLTTDTRVSVYIDGLYYVLSLVPVSIKTNGSGNITIIQATESIVGSCISVKLGNVTETIDPTHQSFAKLAQLSDIATLKKARIVVNDVAGGIMQTPDMVPLISSSVSDADIQAAANSISMLKEAYDSQSKSSVQLFRALSRTDSARPIAMKKFHIDLAGGLAMAAGDLFNWLRTGVDKVVDFIKSAATGLWQFIVKIAGKVYTAVLNTTHAVAGALEWVFDQIQTGVKDLIKYVQFLFQWDDIRRTKDIMHNMVKYYLQDMVSSIKTVQSRFDGAILDAQTAVSKWSANQDWKSLGDSASKRPGAYAVNPARDQTAASQILSNHFQNQAGNITIPQGMPQPSLVQSLINDLIDAMASQGQVFQQTFEQLKQLALDFAQLSLGDVLKRLAGILVNSILGTTQVVVDALFNVLYQVASTAIAVLDTKIHIPIISDILNSIGVLEFSFLDLIMWIGATGFTVAYKIAEGAAPFLDDATSQALIGAQDWSSFSAALGSTPAREQTNDKRPSGSAEFDMPIKPSKEASMAIYTAGHAIAGFIAFTGNFLFFAEAMDISPVNAFGTPSAVMGIVGALAAGGADALVAKMPIENKGVAMLRTATTVCTVVSKLIFSGPGQSILSTSKLSFLKVDDNRKTGAMLNSILVLPALICTFHHFSELSASPAGAERSCAIIGETSGMVQYIGRISYTVALMDPDPETRLVPAGILAGANVIMAGLETACATVF